MLNKNLKTHMLRKHCKHTKGLINAQRCHDDVCIDKSAGIYLVADTLKGSDNPVHVQKSLIGRPTQVLNCESQGCEYLNTVAGISNKTSYEFVHLHSQYNTLQPLPIMYNCKKVL